MNKITNDYLTESNQRLLEQLKDSNEGERCFILGNGPSLKHMNLERLLGEHIFCVNWFCLHQLYSRFEKINYVICDPHFWNYGDGFHEELIHEIVKNKNIQLFLDSSAAQHVRVNNSLESHPKNLSKNSIFLAFNKEMKLWEDSPFHVDFSKPLSWGYTVVIDFCLPLAFHMGFKEVYLLGCDCDYKLKVDKDFKDSFFYDIDRIPESDKRHLRFQRDNKGSQEKNHCWEPSYQKAKDYFELNGRKIFNAGIGGKLEVFNRIEYESLF
ncbi:MAG: hypothetical protein CL677_08570 [Bdellovibrionaceae bacterium]|nr:hypothetical protein [Pseudobdellovibrionaceae bacterium]